MATSGSQTFTVPGSNNQLKIELKWTSTQNNKDNYSNINVKVIIHRGAYGYNTNSTADKQTLWIGGKAHVAYKPIGGANNTSTTLQTVNYRMYHNNDGSMRFQIQLDKYFGVWWSGRLIGTKTFKTRIWDLPQLAGKGNSYLKADSDAKRQQMPEKEESLPKDSVGYRQAIRNRKYKEEKREHRATTFIILDNNFNRIGEVLPLEYFDDKITEYLESGTKTLEFTVEKVNCPDANKITNSSRLIMAKPDGQRELFNCFSIDEETEDEITATYESFEVAHLQDTAPAIEEPTDTQPAQYYLEKSLEGSPIEVGYVAGDQDDNRILSYRAEKRATRIQNILDDFDMFPVYEQHFLNEKDDKPAAVMLNLTKEVGRETSIRLDSKTNLIEADYSSDKSDLITAVKVIPFETEEKETRTVKKATNAVEATPKKVTQTKPKMYTVRSGDSLSLLAQRFGTSVSQLQNWNGITNPDLIRIGQVLRVGTETITTTSGSTASEYPAWPTTEGLRITSGYGPRRAPTAGASSWHPAIDIGGNGVNHPIYATQDGVVTYVGWAGGGGNCVRIRHTGDKYHSQYQHLASTSVQKGQTVRKGQQIARMGTTGTSTGIHLDFAISTNGTFYQSSTTINPQTYLKTKFAVNTTTQGDQLPSKTKKQLDYLARQVGGRYTQSADRNSWSPEPVSADCSSMIYKSLIAAGIPCGYKKGDWMGTTYTLRDQTNRGQYFDKVPNWNSLEPGDIILCNNWGHVVTYTGNGKIFHASSWSKPHHYANASTYRNNYNMIIRPKDRGSRTVTKPKSTETTVFGNSNKDQVYKWLRDVGFNHIPASGIMGNIFVESNYNPRQKQHGGGPGRGLAQWTNTDRWQEAIKFANSNDLDVWTIEAQVKFIKHELTSTWESTNMRNRIGQFGGSKQSNGFHSFNTIKNVEKATMCFLQVYERAGIPHAQRRVNEAKSVYQKYKNALDGKHASTTETAYKTEEVTEEIAKTYDISEITYDDGNIYSHADSNMIVNREAQQLYGFNKQNETNRLVYEYEMKDGNTIQAFESALRYLKKHSVPKEEYRVRMDMMDKNTREELKEVQIGDRIQIVSHDFYGDEPLNLTAVVSEISYSASDFLNLELTLISYQKIEIDLPVDVIQKQELIRQLNKTVMGNLNVSLQADIVNFTLNDEMSTIEAKVVSYGNDFTKFIPDFQFRWQYFDKHGMPIDAVPSKNIIMVGSEITMADGGKIYRSENIVDGRNYRFHLIDQGAKYKFSSYHELGHVMDESELFDSTEDIYYKAPIGCSHIRVTVYDSTLDEPIQLWTDPEPLIADGKKVVVDSDQIDEKMTVECRVKSAVGSINLGKVDYTFETAEPPKNARNGTTWFNNHGDLKVLKNGEWHDMKGQDGKTGQLGQNLLIKSNEEVTTTNYLLAQYDLAEVPEDDEELTLTVKLNEPLKDGRWLRLYNGGDLIDLGYLKASEDDNLYRLTFKWKSSVNPSGRLTTPQGDFIRLYHGPNNNEINPEITIDWAVLARGDIPANDWYASHEEIQQALAEKASSQEYIDTNTIVNQMADKVRDLDTSLEITQESAMIKHSSEYVNTISRLLQNVNDANDTIEKLTQELETVHTYFEFADALTIGKSNSQAKIQIDNELIKFLEGQSVGTFIDRNTLNTSNIYVGNLIELVNHTIETQGNKTIFRYNHNRQGGV